MFISIKTKHSSCPDDETRVVLKSKNKGVSCSDYINANYIKVGRMGRQMKWVKGEKDERVG